VEFVAHISGKSKINYFVLFICSYLQRVKNDQFKSIVDKTPTHALFYSTLY